MFGLVISILVAGVFLLASGGSGNVAFHAMMAFLALWNFAWSALGLTINVVVALGLAGFISVVEDNVWVKRMVLGGGSVFFGWYFAKLAIVKTSLVLGPVLAFFSYSGGEWDYTMLIVGTLIFILGTVANSVVLSTSSSSD